MQEKHGNAIYGLINADLWKMKMFSVFNFMECRTFSQTTNFFRGFAALSIMHEYFLIGLLDKLARAAVNL